VLGRVIRQGGDGDDHRSWLEGPGDRGGNPDCQRARRERERGRMGLGWVSLTDPDPSRVGLAEPSGPVGPAGRLGQQARWAKLALAN
jgi:hypothetical protein